MKKLTNMPHDKNFKVSLSNIEVAKVFLNIHLPKQIFKAIKLNTLSVCQNSYITPDLEEHLSDVLYKAKTINNKDCYTYLLIEHQSTDSWDMPIRILQYQLSIIDSHLKQYPTQKKLPIVFTLLVYNGQKSPYPHTLNIFDLFNDIELAKKTLAKPAHLIDLTTMPDEKIKKHNLIGLLEFAQKHVRDRKFLKQATETLTQILNGLEAYINTSGLIEGNSSWLKNYIHSNLHYLYYFANIINEQEFAEQLETVDFVKREKIMGAMARKIEQQGIEKGRIEGIEKNKAEVAKSMLERNLDLQLISEVTRLTKKEINDLKLKE